MDLDHLEKKLKGISEDLEKEEDLLNQLVKTVSKEDDTFSSIFTENESENESEYHKVNEAYKKYISQYSQEYIEMSEYYYGPDLPYDVYCREFKKEEGTYLDSPQDIKELYSLFIFFMFFDMYTRTGHLPE